MTRPVRTQWVVAAVLGACTFALYASFLGYAPPGLHQHEVFFGLHAEAIAKTARDLDGRFLPLYFRIRLNGIDLWFHPVLVYATAPWLIVLPLSHAALRLPTALVGTLNVVLVYVLARRLFRQTSRALVAGTLLALTPAHFIMSRLAENYLYLVAVILGWLLCLLPAGDARRPWHLVLGGLLLGIGVYTYLGGLVMMPICVILTIATLLVYERERFAIGSLAILMPFGLMLVPLVLWMQSHPDAFGTLAGRYEFYDPTRTNAVGGMLELGRWSSLGKRLQVYLDDFHPRFLLIRGDIASVHSTSKAGVFLLPSFFLAIVGLYRAIVTRPISKTVAVVLAFVVLAPVPGALVGEYFNISRAAMLLPCVALLGAIGFDSLVSAGGRARAIAVAALVLVPLQFGFFYWDYMGHYRLRVSHWLGANAERAFDEVLSRSGELSRTPIFLSQEIPFVDYRWQLYVIQEHHDSLLARTNMTSIDEIRMLPRQALVLSNFDDPTERALLAAGFQRVAAIRDIDGAPSFAVLTR
jgi:hypothetical protein